MKKITATGIPATLNGTGPAMQFTCLWSADGDLMRRKLFPTLESAMHYAERNAALCGGVMYVAVDRDLGEGIWERVAGYQFDVPEVRGTLGDLLGEW